MQTKKFFNSYCCDSPFTIAGFHPLDGDIYKCRSCHKSFTDKDFLNIYGNRYFSSFTSDYFHFYNKNLLYYLKKKNLDYISNTWHEPSQEEINRKYDLKKLSYDKFDTIYFTNVRY